MRWLDDLMQDARLALRMLARPPAFTAASVITLALGIGLSVAMFTVSDAVLRRPLPVQDQDRVVVLWGEAEGSIRRLPLTYEHFERFREAPQTMEEVAGVLNARAWPHAVRYGEHGLSLNLAAVTGNFFTVLGTRPIHGRLLEPDDDVPGAPRVMMISHRLWRTHFRRRFRRTWADRHVARTGVGLYRRGRRAARSGVPDGHGVLGSAPPFVYATGGCADCTAGAGRQSRSRCRGTARVVPARSFRLVARPSGSRDAVV